jgi:hypothetical protein
MKRLQKRYELDEAFRGLVDGIQSHLRRNGFTSLEICSAAALACLRHEMTTARRDFTLDMIVNAAFPELGLIVKEPTRARQESLAQRNKERTEVLQKLATSETPEEALKILSAWRERRKAFDL